MRPTAGHPVVVAKSNGATAPNNGPRVLFYGHYDVQPVDPLELWSTPPFEPRSTTLPDGRKIIVARGACDDKGQVMTFVEACRAFKAVTGELPLPITMMIEGEEECGSKNLFDFVRDNADEFKRDLALVCDTGMWDHEDAGDHHVAARPGLRGGARSPAPTATCIPACSAARRRTRSACSRRSSPALHDDERPRHDPGLLRRRAGAAGRHQGRPRRRST